MLEAKSAAATFDDNEELGGVGRRYETTTYFCGNQVLGGSVRSDRCFVQMTRSRQQTAAEK